MGFFENVFYYSTIAFCTYVIIYAYAIILMENF